MYECGEPSFYLLTKSFINLDDMGEMKEMF